jgi:hypothetical protein
MKYEDVVPPGVVMQIEWPYFRGERVRIERATADLVKTLKFEKKKKKKKKFRKWL